MTRNQLSAFLTVSRTRVTAYERRHYPLFLLLARSGMRLGEPKSGTGAPFKDSNVGPAD
jgi:hypothetical protein